MQQVADIGGNLIAGAEPLDKLGGTAAPQAGERELLFADIRVDAADRERRGVGHVRLQAVGGLDEGVGGVKEASLQGRGEGNVEDRDETAFGWNGCPMAALASDIRHRPPPARSAMTAGIRTQIDRLAKALPDSVTANRRRKAVGTYAAMIGALILARAADHPALPDEILQETRSWLAHEDGEVGVQTDATRKS